MIIRLWWLVLFSVTGFAQSGDAGSPILATVNGVNIYEADLKIQGQLLQVQRQEYEIRRRALHDAISTKALELAAKAKGMSTEEFLASEDKIDEPTEAGLRGFYLAEIGRYKQQPFEKVREAVEKDFKEAERQARRLALVNQLLRSEHIEVFIDPPRTDVDSAGAPRRGPASAPVTIVEFSDFQCPFCKSVQPTLKAIEVKYGDKVALAFKDFPLTDAHPQAQPAAEASHCAADQGKFWSYHDLLFTASPDFSKDLFLQFAVQAGLDHNAFEACLDSGKDRSQVAQSVEQGKALGVDATPTFFINGVALTGAVALEDFEALIDAELVVERRVQ